MNFLENVVADWMFFCIFVGDKKKRLENLTNIELISLTT